MIRFFSNRELSEKLDINLAKWKRWSRELLPPDPLGGLQSGYARQYNPAEAFIVYLGGHLIADLKYTIPECKQILADLYDWLTRHGFLFEPAMTASEPDVDSSVLAYQISVTPNAAQPGEGPPGFYYVIRGIVHTDRKEFKDMPVQREYISETVVPGGVSLPPWYQWENLKLLNITAIHNRFKNQLDL